MAFSNLLSTNAFLIAYALSEQAGTRASPEPVTIAVLRNLKGLSDLLPFALHSGIQELAEQKMVEIKPLDNGKDGLERIASVRATRALTEYVDGFGL